jgi:hypothetical protein
MTSAFSQPTGQAGYPLQPTAEGPQVPPGLDVDGPGHTPIPQHAHGYVPNTQHDSSNPSAAGGNYTGVTNASSGFSERREGYDQPREGLTGHREGFHEPGIGNTHAGLNEPHGHIGQQHHKNPLAPSHAPVTTGGGGENFIGIPTTTLDVTSPDPKTIIVSGGGVGYTMITSYENKREVVTIRRTGSNQGQGGPNFGQHNTTGGNYGGQTTGTGAHVGHQIAGGHQTGTGTNYGQTTGTGTDYDQTTGTNFGHQTTGTGTHQTTGAYDNQHGAAGAAYGGHTTATGAQPNVHNLPPSQAGLGTHEPALMTAETDDDPVVAQVEPHQLRATKISFKGGPQIKLKDWLGGRGTNIHTFVEGDQKFEWRKSFKGLHHQLELFSSEQPDNRLAWAEKISTTEETLKEHEPGRPPLPAPQGTARLTLTERALPLIDTVVVSFLLVDRETRHDPLHA